MLCLLFGLRPQFEERVTELGGGHLEAVYTCTLYSPDNVIMGQGIGSCSTMESKYRYRNASMKCPLCGKESIIKGKAEYGGGWICFAKKGGCGAKFKEGAPEIEKQERGKIENVDISDQRNTARKMAKKRSHIDAALTTTGASEFFTQDVEDMDFGVVEGSFVETTPPPQARPVATAPKAAAAKPAPALQPTKAMFNKLHAIGVQKFGPEWDDARHELVGKLTEGRTQSSRELTYDEVVKLAEQVKSFADFFAEDAPLFDDEPEMTTSGDVYGSK
jgi:hypothetical protein